MCASAMARPQKARAARPGKADFVMLDSLSVTARLGGRAHSAAGRLVVERAIAPRAMAVSKVIVPRQAFAGHQVEVPFSRMVVL